MFDAPGTITCRRPGYPPSTATSTLSSLRLLRGKRGLAVASAMAVVLVLAACGGTGRTLEEIGAPSMTLAGPTAPARPALTEVFTSSVGGYTIGYPAGARISAATQAAPVGVHTWDGDSPYVDNFLDTFGTGSLSVISAAVPSTVTPAQWVADELAAHLLTGSAFPDCAAAMTTDPVVVDGVAGVIDTHCAPIDLGAVVTSGGRAYLIDLRADPPDMAWLLEVLATMHLHPDAAATSGPTASGVP